MDGAEEGAVIDFSIVILLSPIPSPVSPLSSVPLRVSLSHALSFSAHLLLSAAVAVRILLIDIVTYKGIRYMPHLPVGGTDERRIAIVHG